MRSDSRFTVAQDTTSHPSRISSSLEQRGTRRNCDTRRRSSAGSAQGSGPTEVKVPTTPTTIKILRLPQVCSVTGLRRTMIYRLQRDGRFPRSVKITDYAVGWVESEVQTWLAHRAAERGSDQISRSECPGSDRD